MSKPKRKREAARARGYWIGAAVIAVIAVYASLVVYARAPSRPPSYEAAAGGAAQNAGAQEESGAAQPQPLTEEEVWRTPDTGPTWTEAKSGKFRRTPV